MEWYEKIKERFILEIELLRKYHPRARVVISNHILYIFKEVRGKRARYLIKIKYPEDFPYSPPSAYPVKPRIKGTPHQYGDGELCLHALNEVSPKTSGKIICDWVDLWIKAYEVWITSGKRYWPKQKETEAKWMRLK